MKAARPKRRKTGDRPVEDLSTPLWDRYYRALRKRLRLPRAHRRSLQG